MSFLFRKRGLCSLFVAFAFVLIVAPGAFATGANPNVVVTLKQPVGSSFKARIWVDEFIHGYEAL